MKITFMGAGGCIEEKGSKFVATMIECGDSIYFVDAGCAIADGLFRLEKDLSDVRGLFLTHYHCDHTAGVFPFVDLANWACPDISLKLVSPTREYIEALEGLVFAGLSNRGKIDNQKIELVLAKEGRIYEDENIFVDYIPTKHFKNGDVPSYAVLITERESGKKALFSGDLSYSLKGNDLPKDILKECDLFVCELYHFTAEELLPYLESFDGTLCINHLFEKDKKKPEIIKALSGNSFKILAPENNDIIEI